MTIHTLNGKGSADMTMQAVATYTNHESLCICEITMREAEAAMAVDSAFDGSGLYLVSVDKRSPMEPGKVLAKFVSDEAAAALASFFRLHGHLEAA